jgi:hypothetical protein
MYAMQISKLIFVLLIPLYNAPVLIHILSSSSREMELTGYGFDHGDINMFKKKSITSRELI